MTNEGMPATKRQKRSREWEVWSAIIDGDSDRVGHLLADGGEAVCRSNSVCAAVLHNAACLERLVLAGMDLEREDVVSEETAMETAVICGNIEAIGVLVRAGASTSTTGDYPDVEEAVAASAARRLAEDAGAKAFCTGMHPRLGDQSPLQYLAGSEWIAKFIARTAFDPLRTMKNAPVLL